MNSSSAANPVRSLEALKDRIIAAINASTLDSDVKKMWCGDAREMYYSVVLLEGILAQSRDAGPAETGLHDALSRYEQVSSELRALGKAGEALEQELRKTFMACHEQLSAQLPRGAQPASAPPQRVIQRSAESYELPCSVCGQIAVEVHPAGSEEKILRGIICAGITRAVGLDPARNEDFFRWLAAGDLASFHACLEDHVDGGLDAYCPTCDRIYCRRHYNVQEEFDEGFYDCSRGICPQGHARKIDD